MKKNARNNPVAGPTMKLLGLFHRKHSSTRKRRFDQRESRAIYYRALNEAQRRIIN